MTHSTKDNTPYTIRKPVEADAESIIEYSKIMFASTDQTLTTLEEFNVTVDGEKAWIKNFNESPGLLALVAELNQKIIGLIFFMSHPKKKCAHTGEFGVSIHPDYRGQGVGRALIEEMLNWAKENPVIEKVILQVFASNTVGLSLYKSLGFTEEGRFIKSAKQSNGDYVDGIQMYRWVK